MSSVSPTPKDVESNDTITETSPPSHSRTYRTCWYLAIFEANSSRIVELPDSGETIIGRGAGAKHVSLEEPDVSREHARILSQAGGVYVADSASHNGTYVNGKRLPPGPWRLSPHDEISIANAKLLVTRVRSAGTGSRSAPQQRTLQQLMSAGSRSLHDEIRSATDRKESLALVYWATDSPVAHGRLWSVLDGLLNSQDLIVSDGTAIVAAISAQDIDAAMELATLALAHCSDSTEHLRAGCATYPLHAVDAEGLLWAAREAARMAPRGCVRSAASILEELEIRDSQILIGDSTMRETRDLIRRLAPSNLSVLVTGESGTGKEWAATALHVWSPRSNKPFVAFNCTAVVPTMLESELFGHVRGAFSGAIENRKGLFEDAHGGTLFIDEVGDMPLEMQAKLLRVIETQRIRRVGENAERQVDVRIVAATNRDLAAHAQKGHFRLDLYHRLAAASIRLPALRERALELPALAHRLLNQGRKERNAAPMTLSIETLLLLRAYSWPGNVRELKNVMTHAAWQASLEEHKLLDCHLSVAIRDGAGTISESLTADAAKPPEEEKDRSFRPLKEEVRELERRRMREALQQTAGDKTAAARLLHMPVRTFYSKYVDETKHRDPQRR